MQLKRISAILLVVALIFSVTSIFVGAEAVEAVESVEVGVEAETAAPVSSSPKIFNGSDEVSVKIRVNQNTGVTFLRFVIYFNSEALEYVDYKSDNLFNSQTESIQVRNGYLIYFLNLDSDISEAKGDLMSINFKAKPGYCGDVEIYTELANKSDANCAKYHSSAKNTYVPFTAGKDSFEVHSVDVSKGVVTAPTCTENGFTTYECSNCKEKLIGNTVDKLGHVNAKPVEEKW